MSRFLKISISAFLVANILSSVRGLFQIHYLSKILTVLFIAVIGYEFFKNKFRPQPKQLRFLLLLLPFPVWALITSFWSIRPDITALASVNYIVMVLVFFSLGLIWMKYNSSENFLILFLPANIIVLGIALFSIVTGLPADAWSGGHGRGLMSFWDHQNTLAITVLVTLPGIFALLKDYEPSPMSYELNKLRRHWWSFGHSLFNDKRLLLFFLLLSLNFILIMLTYSRAAMLAVFVGVVCYLVLNKNYKILVSGLLLLAVFSLLAISVKSINTTVYKLLAKHDMPIFATREILWGPSFEAAKKNIFIGIGYALSDQTIISGPGTASKFDKKVGLYKREKGNGYLALVEETGIIGLIFFMLPILFLIIYLYKRNNTHAIILLSLIVVFLFQALFDAWFNGTGIFFRMFLFLIIFSVFGVSYINSLYKFNGI